MLGVVLGACHLFISNFCYSVVCHLLEMGNLRFIEIKLQPRIKGHVKHSEWIRIWGFETYGVHLPDSKVFAIWNCRAVSITPQHCFRLLVSGLTLLRAGTGSHSYLCFRLHIFSHIVGAQ